MLNRLKGFASSKLLSSPSNHTVSKASLLGALTIATGIAALCLAVAFAQWRLAGNIVKLQQQNAKDNSERIEAAAEMATHQANAHRGTLNALLSRDNAELQEAILLHRSNLRDYTMLTESLSQSPELHKSAEELRDLTTRYNEISLQVIEKFRAGEKDQALDLRLRTLRPLFNSWQEAHGNFTKQLGRSADEQRAQFEAVTSASKQWLAGLLLTPIVLIVLGLLASAAILGFHRLSGRQSDTWAR
jgi:hypothetical protein